MNPPRQFRAKNTRTKEYITLIRTTYTTTADREKAMVFTSPYAAKQAIRAANSKDDYELELV